MPAASSARLWPVSRITASTCSAAIRASPVVVLSSSRMWPEVSPPTSPPVSRNMREHVAVTDLGTAEIDALLAQRHLEPEVAHDRPDHGSLEQARRACAPWR